MMTAVTHLAVNSARRHIAPALLWALTSCTVHAAVDAGSDATTDMLALDAQVDGTPADRVDSFDAGPADRPRIDDFVFDDVVDEVDRDAGGGMQTGTLIGGTGALPGPIAGLRYSVSGVADVTGATGTFHYTPGATVTFQIADVSFRATPGRARLSPFQLAGSGACVHSGDLEKALVLIYSLDADGDPATGTTLPAYPQAAATRMLSDLSMADIATLVGQLIPGRALLSPAEATDRFIRQIDDEAWMSLGLDSFRLFTAVTRGQGVATDGTRIFFSGTDGLERTDTSYRREAANLRAIPMPLETAGSNHVGDIDLWNGVLYAPVEDGRAYSNPLIVLFDPETLAAGATFTVPHALQTQGVPWVAINGAAGELYLAEWAPTTQLNIFALSTVTYLRSVPLRPTVGRIQGAKMFDGALYMASDDATKAIFKVNVETGTVIHLFDVPITSENEGLAFFTRGDGSQMHTLNVAADRLGAELRHHRRARDPLRHLVCP
ncbi:MAG: hypothetical protein WCJ30_22485 [Deltaproteobacteria bacterium]